MTDRRSKVPFVYLTSPSFSGSTLLTILLSAHPDIATIGEWKGRAMGDVERYHCSCGQLIRRCAFWQAVGEEMKRRGVDFDVSRLGLDFAFDGSAWMRRVVSTEVRGPGFEAARWAAITVWPGCRRSLERTLGRNEACADVLRSITGAHVVLDSSKDPIRLSYLLASTHLDIRVIHLVRDGRGVANSFRRHHHCSIERGASEFAKAHRAAERVLSRMAPKRFMRLNYEHLCACPDRWIKKICTFAGVDPTRLPDDLTACEHHVLGNSMRLGGLSEIRCDTRWRDEFDAADEAAFQRVAGDVNKMYGYRRA